MRANYWKLSLGTTINNMHEVVSTDVCFNYGSMSGCDSGCPALLNGDCKNFGDVLSNTDLSDLDENELSELKTLYIKEKK